MPVKSLTPQDVQKGITGFDAVILPSINKDVLATSRRASGSF